jgi:phospholipase/carboxylesterase
MEHTKQLIKAGKPLTQAKKALIMLHGRGASAEDILSLCTHLPVDDFYVVAPQATNGTWYPYSFLAPPAQNEPWLGSALKLVGSIVLDIEKAGMPSSQIFLLGFSQGACLTLEFAARQARPWGGVVVLTGGLIGDQLYTQHYVGDFGGIPILMTNSQNDPHVPLQRSEDSKNQLERMGARVSLEVYPNRPHTILMEELEKAGRLLN